MIYTDLTNKAMKIAYEAHMAQKDAGGIPYIFHPYHLAEQMNTETRCCIALLHDVIEDTDVLSENLEKEFPLEVTEALELLTHRRGEDYFDYIRKICKNRNAAFVKAADLIHNMTESRLCGTAVSEKEKDRWLQKYIEALSIITDAVSREILTPCCTDEIQWRQILDQYSPLNRRVVLDIEDHADKYLTPGQIGMLQGKPVESQMSYFEVIIIHEKEGSVLDDYSRSEKVDLEKFIENNGILLKADGCIVGMVDINVKDVPYCKHIVAQIFLNRYRECRYSKTVIDHSWDHYAAITESVSYMLKIKE